MLKTTNTNILYLPIPISIIDDQNLKSVPNTFYITYLLISRNANLEHKSYITMQQIFDFYNQITRSTKPKLFTDALVALKYLQDKNMIELLNDLSKLSYNTHIEITIRPDCFYSQSYKMIFIAHLDYIQSLPNMYKKDNVIKVYLYLLRNIFNRGSKFINPTPLPDYIYKPEACWASISTISNMIGITPKTTRKCLDILSKDTVNAPFRKFEHNNQNTIPFVYAFNVDGYQNELHGGYKKLCQYKYGNIISNEK